MNIDLLPVLKSHAGIRRQIAGLADEAKKAIEASVFPMGMMKHDLEVRHGRALIAVAEAGSIGGAARALGVAQSTLSETLLSLERLLGVSVTLRRSGQVAKLTAAAEALLPYARTLVSASERAMSVGTTGTLPTTIRLGTVESISSFILPRPLSKFRRRWPATDVRITTGVCGDLHARLRQGQVDAVITMDGGSRDGIDDIATVRLVLIVAPHHRLANAAISRSELAAETFLLSDSEGPLTDVVDAWIDHSGLAPRYLSAGSIEGVKRAVLNGDGIGTLPEYAVTDELKQGLFAAIRCSRLLPQVALKFTMLAAPHEGSAIAGLLAEIRQALDAIDAASRSR